MILGNQIEWVLHCMTVLAGLPSEKCVNSKILAQFHGVPKEYLAKAMNALAQAGLVEGTLGPRGGYRLAKKPEDISMLDIVEAVEGRERTFRCQNIRLNNPCLTDEQRKPNGICIIAKSMFEADEAWRNVLREKKLSHMMDEVKETVPASILDASVGWIEAHA